MCLLPAFGSSEYFRMSQKLQVLRNKNHLWQRDLIKFVAFCVWIEPDHAFVQLLSKYTFGVCVCVFATAMADYKVGRALILRLLCTSISPQPEGSHTQVFGSVCWIQWITLWCQVWFKFAFQPRVLPNFIAADTSYLWRMLRAGTGSHLLRVKNPGTESQEAGEALPVVFFCVSFRCVVLL